MNCPHESWAFDGRCLYVEGPDGERVTTIAVVAEHEDQHERQQSRMACAAAAPELYRALEALAAHYGDDAAPGEPLHDARAALAKARGETP